MYSIFPDQHESGSAALAVVGTVGAVVLLVAGGYFWLSAGSDGASALSSDSGASESLATESGDFFTDSVDPATSSAATPTRASEGESASSDSTENQNTEAGQEEDPDSGPGTDSEASVDVQASGESAKQCENEECMTAALSDCQPAVLNGDVAFFGDVQGTQEIFGRDSTGACRVELVFADHPYQQWENKPITCNYDTSSDFETATMGAIQEIPEGNPANCEGQLVAEFQEMFSPSSDSTAEEETDPSFDPYPAGVQKLAREVVVDCDSESVGDKSEKYLKEEKHAIRYQLCTGLSSSKNFPEFGDGLVSPTFEYKGQNSAGEYIVEMPNLLEECQPEEQAFKKTTDFSCNNFSVTLDALSNSTDEYITFDVRVAAP